MSSPYEIIAGPADVYLAAVGSTFPVVNATPSSPWVLLGTSGSKNYDESGVKLDQSQTMELVYSLGCTGPVKAFRTKEGLKFSLVLMDMTLEQYSKALNGVTVSEVSASSGVAGTKSIPLRRGSDVTEYTLLLKSAMSPEGDSLSMQYRVKKVFVDGNVSPVFVKGKPIGLEFSFVALEDLTASPGEEFGTLVVQTAAAGA